jgi:hypothetical protein
MRRIQSGSGLYQEHDHASARGHEPPQADMKERHQHNRSRLDPFTSLRLAKLGIP